MKCAVPYDRREQHLKFTLSSRWDDATEVSSLTLLLRAMWDGVARYPTLEATMKIALATLLILLGVQATFAQDKGVEVEQTQGFLKGYNELRMKYPKAAEFLSVVDAKTRSQLPVCPGQMPCCIKSDQHPPHCVSWSCCDIIR